MDYNSLRRSIVGAAETVYSLLGLELSTPTYHRWKFQVAELDEAVKDYDHFAQKIELRNEDSKKYVTKELCELVGFEQHDLLLTPETKPELDKYSELCKTMKGQCATAIPAEDAIPLRDLVDLLQEQSDTLQNSMFHCGELDLTPVYDSLALATEVASFQELHTVCDSFDEDFVCLSAQTDRMSAKLHLPEEPTDEQAQDDIFTQWNTLLTQIPTVLKDRHTAEWVLSVQPSLVETTEKQALPSHSSPTEQYRSLVPKDVLSAKKVWECRWELNKPCTEADTNSPPNDNTRTASTLQQPVQRRDESSPPPAGGGGAHTWPQQSQQVSTPTSQTQRTLPVKHYNNNNTAVGLPIPEETQFDGEERRGRRNSFGDKSLSFSDSTNGPLKTIERKNRTMNETLEITNLLNNLTTILTYKINYLQNTREAHMNIRNMQVPWHAVNGTTKIFNTDQTFLRQCCESALVSLRDIEAKSTEEKQQNITALMEYLNQSDKKLEENTAKIEETWQEAFALQRKLLQYGKQRLDEVYGRIRQTEQFCHAMGNYTTFFKGVHYVRKQLNLTIDMCDVSLDYSDTIQSVGKAIHLRTMDLYKEQELCMKQHLTASVKRWKYIHEAAIKTWLDAGAAILAHHRKYYEAIAEESKKRKNQLTFMKSRKQSKEDVAKYYSAVMILHALKSEIYDIVVTIRKQSNNSYHQFKIPDHTYKLLFDPIWVIPKEIATRRSSVTDTTVGSHHSVDLGSVSSYSVTSDNCDSARDDDTNSLPLPKNNSYASLPTGSGLAEEGQQQLTAFPKSKGVTFRPRLSVATEPEVSSTPTTPMTQLTTSPSFIKEIGSVYPITPAHGLRNSMNDWYTEDGISPLQPLPEIVLPDSNHNDVFEGIGRPRSVGKLLGGTALTATRLDDIDLGITIETEIEEGTEKEAVVGDSSNVVGLTDVGTDTLQVRGLSAADSTSTRDSKALVQRYHASNRFRLAQHQLQKRLETFLKRMRVSLQHDQIDLTTENVQTSQIDQQGHTTDYNDHEGFGVDALQSPRDRHPSTKPYTTTSDYENFVNFVEGDGNKNIGQDEQHFVRVLTRSYTDSLEYATYQEQQSPIRDTVPLLPTNKLMKKGWTYKAAYNEVQNLSSGGLPLGSVMNSSKKQVHEVYDSRKDLQSKLDYVYKWKKIGGSPSSVSSSSSLSSPPPPHTATHSLVEGQEDPLPQPSNSSALDVSELSGNPDETPLTSPVAVLSTTSTMFANQSQPSTPTIHPTSPSKSCLHLPKSIPHNDNNNKEDSSTIISDGEHQLPEHNTHPTTTATMEGSNCEVVLPKRHINQHPVLKRAPKKKRAAAGINHPSVEEQIGSLLPLLLPSDEDSPSEASDVDDDLYSEYDYEDEDLLSTCSATAGGGGEEVEEVFGKGTHADTVVHVSPNNNSPITTTGMLKDSAVAVVVGSLGSIERASIVSKTSTEGGGGSTSRQRKKSRKSSTSRKLSKGKLPTAAPLPTFSATTHVKHSKYSAMYNDLFAATNLVSGNNKGLLAERPATVLAATTKHNSKVKGELLPQGPATVSSAPVQTTFLPAL